MKNLRDMNIPVFTSSNIVRFADGRDARLLKGSAKAAPSFTEYYAEKNAGGLLYAYRK